MTTKAHDATAGSVGQPATLAVRPGGYTPTVADLAAGVPRPWPSVPALVLSVVACATQIFCSKSDYSLPTIACGGIEAAVLVLLITRYATVRPPRLPWIELMFGLHYFNFGLSLAGDPVALGLIARVPRSDSFEFASLLALVSGLVMIGAFAFTRFISRSVSGASLLAKLDPDILSAGSRIYVPITVAYTLLTVRVGFAPQSSLSAVSGILSPFFSLTPLVVVTTVAYLTRPNARNLLQLVAAFATAGIIVARTSMLGEIFLQSVAFFVLWWRGKERLPLVPMVATLAVALVLQPVKPYFRQVHWGENPDVTGVLDAWEEAFSRAATESKSSFSRSQSGSEATVTRVGELSSVAYVVENVPASIPHTDGIIYPMMLTAIVPRIFWPEKPNMTRYALNSFVIALNLADPEGTETSTTGLSLVAQGYFEHGIPGSIGWMALFGMTAALLSRYFGTKTAGVVAGTAMMVPFCLASAGGFFNVFGGLWQLIFGATALSWLLWFLGMTLGPRLRRTVPLRV